MGKPLYFVQRNWDAGPIAGIFAAALLKRNGTVKTYASKAAAQGLADLLNRPAEHQRVVHGRQGRASDEKAMNA
jgi:hypothetical protein